MRIIMISITALLLSFSLTGCGDQASQTENEESHLEELQVLKKSKMYEGVDYAALAKAIAKEQGEVK